MKTISLYENIYMRRKRLIDNENSGGGKYKREKRNNRLHEEGMAALSS